MEDTISEKRLPSEQLVHPIATRRFIIYLPATKSNWNHIHTCMNHTMYGDRDVFVMGKNGIWFRPMYYGRPGGLEMIQYTDSELVKHTSLDRTVLGIMLEWENFDCGDQIACHFHAEIYDVPPSDKNTVKELVFQIKSRHFCPTDDSIDVVLSLRNTLKEETALVKKMKSDLFKESKNYITRLTRSVGDIMEETRPITEDTFISASEELNKRQKDMAEDIRAMYMTSYDDKGRVCNIATLLVDTMVDRLIDSVYQKGIKQSNKKLVEAISTVERLMPPSLGYRVPFAFIELKKKQLALAYDIEVYKREQKELRRRKLETEREERRALKELEKELKQAEKDEQNTQAAIERNKFEMAQAKTKEQIRKFQEQINKLEEALKQAQERRERALSMAQQTKCGYVYVISNIGSFGEGVYKIGMTRRVEPMERVVELGDASVPFPFDVHAMIYTEDAPSLEAELHRVFDSRKLNSVNGRKEFFRVPIHEIREQVENFGIVCEWVEKPVAKQYRDSQYIK